MDSQYISGDYMLNLQILDQPLLKQNLSKIKYGNVYFSKCEI